MTLTVLDTFVWVHCAPDSTIINLFPFATTPRQSLQQDNTCIN